MARTGQPAYDAGMRGGEQPKEKPAKKGGKRKIRRIEIERASTGHIVTVQRHPPKAKANEPMPFVEPEKHAHGTPEEAKAHVNELMDQMSPSGDEE